MASYTVTEDDMNDDWILNPDILCDNCKIKKGSKRCSDCHCFYFCSAECSKSNWRNPNSFHRSTCKLQRDARESNQRESVVVTKNTNKLEQSLEANKNEACSICLQDVESSVQLPCSHLFCTNCVMEYTSPNNHQSRSCPLCRHDLSDNNILQHIYQTGVQFIKRASSEPHRKYYWCSLAVKQLKRVEDYASLFEQHVVDDCLTDPSTTASDIEDIRKSIKQKFLNPIFISKVSIGEALLFQEEYSDCINICTETMNPHFEKKYLLMLNRYIAESQIHLQKYEDAFKTTKIGLQLVGDDITNKYAVNIRYLLAIMTSILYYQGKYQEAVQVGKSALLYNRSKRGVYKFLILSYEAMNEYSNAKILAEKAVSYEEPWDASIVAGNKQSLDELKTRIAAQMSATDIATEK